MIHRCTCKSEKCCKNYGGRGITVCDEWLKFENFYRDMGDRPDRMTLDRIDNNKGYCKENCRWATNEEQANNKRTNVFYAIDGEDKTLAQWARIMGINYKVLFDRIHKYGWTVEKALTTRLRRYKKRAEKQSKTAALCRKLSFSRTS